MDRLKFGGKYLSLGDIRRYKLPDMSGLLYLVEPSYQAYCSRESLKPFREDWNDDAHFVAYQGRVARPLSQVNTQSRYTSEFPVQWAHEHYADAQMKMSV